MPRYYDAFLSHASADKRAVEHLARKLREAGLKPFLDKWHLIPGEPWQEGIEEALRESRTCTVFIGKKLGPWQNEEMRIALAKRVKNRSFRVIPVLLPGGPESALDELSEFLGRLTWVDFRTGLYDEDAFRRLLAGIRGKAPGPGEGAGETPPLLLSGPYRCMAPAREPFVPRREYEEAVQALLGGSGGDRAPTVGLTTALQGAGGFGKTALAIELCYDSRIRERFPDGILWAQMRDNLDSDGRLKEIRDLLRAWTQHEPPAFETVDKAGRHLIELLHGKRVLLVVDDAWSLNDVAPFQGLHPEATLLVTTRISRVLSAESIRIRVDAMESLEAVELLGMEISGNQDPRLGRLSARLGGWPLLLKIVNRQLREILAQGLSLEKTFGEIEDSLAVEGLAAFDREDSRNHAVALTVGASLQKVSSEDSFRFDQLAIFPEGRDIPLAVLGSLWALGEYQAKKLCERLWELSLLLRFDREAGTIRLHDVIRAYLLKKGDSHLLEWNRRLLDAYRPANGRWSELPRDESYLWSHLVHHLIGAGQGELCRDLLLDFRYLRSKLEATDINDLLAEYSLFAEKVQELRLVRDALRLSAHVLARNPTELREQLYGRLLDRQEPGIRGLLQTSADSGTLWLRPRKASLTRPGSALIRTIDHPGTPDALAVLPNGQVLSGSWDGALRVWDVESGQAIQVLEGHSDTINSVAVLDRCRVVSGSDDGTLRLWDVERGKALQTLEGHSGKVFSVAVLDSHRVVSGSEDGTLRVWNVESGQAPQILEESSNWVQAVAVLDSHRVVSGSEDGTLRVWDVESGQVLQVLEGSSIYTMAVFDSRRVISGSEDGTLRVWDAESGRVLHVFKGGVNPIYAVAVLDSRRVVSTSDRLTLRVWDVENGQALQVLEGHSDWVNDVAVLAGRRVVSSSEDGTLRVWDLEGDRAPETLDGHINPVSYVVGVNSRRVVSDSNDGMLRVWDVESGGETLAVLHKRFNTISVVAVLDRCRVVSGLSETLWVWDVESGQTLQVLKGHSGEVSVLVVLDSRRVVSGSSDGTLHVWDVESGRALQVFKVSSSKICAVAVLDSRRVVSGSSDGTLHVWDVESGRALQVFKGGSSKIYEVAVLDSRRVVSRSYDRALRVWDVESGKALQVLKGHSTWVTAVAVLDSHRVVSGSGDGTLRVWDVESGQALQVVRGHSGGVTGMVVLDSRWVVSVFNQTLMAWDAEGGETESLFTLDSPVTALAAIPGRHAIVAGDYSGRVHFFDLGES